MRYYKDLYINPKEIHTLFSAQMRAIAHSKGTLFILAGLIILPSFYAWFNIYSVWDPYSKTENLKVAMVNDDAGYTFHDDNNQIPRSVSINAGDMLVVELNKNRKFDWQFVSREKAMKGVKDGRYYAAIVISKDFSKNLTSFTKEQPTRGKIHFYVNEKINAISPKVTETGMNTLQSEIDKSFTASISEVVLNGLADFDDRYIQIKPTLIRMIDTLDLINNQMSNFELRLSDYERALQNLNNFTQEAKDKIPENIQRTRDLQALTLNAQNTLLAGKNDLYTIENLLNEQLSSLPTEVGSLNNDIRALSRLADDQSQVAEKYLNRLSDRADALSKRADDNRRDLIRLQNILPVKLAHLDQLIDRLDTLSKKAEEFSQDVHGFKEALHCGNLNLNDATDRLINLSDILEETAEETRDLYREQVRPNITTGIDQMVSALDQTYLGLNNLSDFMIKSSDLLGDSIILNANGQAALMELRPILDATETGIAAARTKADKLKNDSQFNRATEIIKQDIASRANFIANPVDVKKKELYPLGNYGSAMAPFYTVLALWVGAMLTMSIVSPVNIKGLKVLPKAQFADMYVSRLLLFVLIAVCQGLVVTLGNLFFLGITVVHPWLYLLASLAIAAIFGCFVFSLIFTFGNLGKAIAIIFLVLQISAGGGTFPVEMMPRFFRVIHPILPFTYAISLLRELSAGINPLVVRTDILALATVPIFSFLMVLIFGPSLRHIVHRLEKAIKNGGLE